MRIISTSQSFIKSHRVELLVGLLAISIVIATGLLMERSKTKVSYQPTAACDLLTLPKAQELLGNKALGSNLSPPVPSGDTATSKCAYTDGNPDINRTVVAAIIVRSGLNDKGVEQNKTDFTASQSGQPIETLKNLGDNAYFNQTLGQLHILHGRNWIIASYGTGATPEQNTISQVSNLARVILH